MAIQKRKDKWQVRVFRRGRSHYLGLFERLGDAQAAEKEFIDSLTNLGPKPPAKYSKEWYEQTSKEQVKTLPQLYK